MIMRKKEIHKTNIYLSKNSSSHTKMNTERRGHSYLKIKAMKVLELFDI